MNVSDFVSNDIEVVAPGTVPVYRIKEAANYDFAARGVTQQFLGDAASYYDRYTNPAHFRHLYSIAFRAGQIDPARVSRVLDIGTGGGNSVFAIRDLAPKAQITGVDISQPLLEMCARAATDQFNVRDDSLAMLVADLYDLKPIANSVDLISGASILHHMLDPEALVLHVMRALKPGGRAIFNEPLEEAHSIFRAIVAGILEDNESRADARLPDSTLQFMAAYVRDFDARRGIGHVRDHTKWLDDKWFFTRSWFEDVARKSKCSAISITRTHGGMDMFWRQFVVMARLFGDPTPPDALPSWAKRRFALFDESLSDRQKEDCTFSAVVVMQRA